MEGYDKQAPHNYPTHLGPPAPKFLRTKPVFNYGAIGRDPVSVNVSFRHQSLMTGILLTTGPCCHPHLKALTDAFRAGSAGSDTYSSTSPVNRVSGV